MAVERGGLEYTIRVNEAFASATELFRREIAASRAEWAAFRRDLETTTAPTAAISRDMQKAALAVRELAKAAQRENTTNAERIRTNNELTKILIDLNRAEVDLSKTLSNVERAQNSLNRSVKDRNKTLSIEIEAERRLDRLVRERAVRVSFLEQAQRRNLNVSKLATSQLEAQAAATQRVAQAEAKAARNLELTRRGFTDRGEQAKSLEQLADARVQREIRKLDEQLAFERAAAGSERLRELRLQMDAVRNAAKGQAKELTVLEEAEQRLQRAQRKRAIAAALQARGFAPTGERIQTLEEVTEGRVQRELQRLNEQLAFKKAIEGNRNIRDLRRELGELDGRANRISFTFRRLFGILFAFTAARAAIRAIRSMIVETIAFQSRLEQAQLGIATLLTSVGDVRDALGGTVSRSRALALAQAEAARQTALLRVDALRTAATFDELVNAFQVGLAPGLRAGLNIDQIRQFAVRISQAAAAIGLPFNQLNEEIRSLLTGTIQQRTTRIAAALGITNEDIRRAREAGRLAEFLEDRFEAFAVSGAEAATTFQVLFSNAKDALQQLLGAAGAEFFEEIKSFLQDILDDVVTLTDQGPIINPDAVRILDTLFAGLTAAVAEGRRLRDALDLEDFRGLALVIGTTLTIAFRTLGGLLQGAIRAVGQIADIISVIVITLRQAGGLFQNLIPTGAFSELLSAVAQMGTRLAGMVIAVGLIYRGARLLIAPFTILYGLLLKKLIASKAIQTVLLNWRKILAFLVSPVAAALLLFIGIFQTIKNITEGVLGVRLSIRQLITVIALGLVGAWDDFVDRIKAGAAVMKQLFIALWVSVRSSFVQLVLKPVEAILQAIRHIPGLDELESLERITEKISKLRRDDLNALEKTRAEFKRQTEEIRRQADLRNAERENLQGLRLEAILDQPEGADPISQILGNIREEFDKFFAVDVTGPAQRLSEVFEELPAQISATTEELEKIDQTLKEITDDTEKAAAGLAFEIDFGGLTGRASELARLAQEGRLERLEAERGLQNSLREAESRRLEIASQLESNLSRRAALSRREQGFLEAAERLATEYLDLQDRIARSETDIALIEQERLGAVAEGNAEAAEALALSRDAKRRELAQLQEGLRLIQQQSDALAEGIDTDRQEQLFNLLRQRIQLTGEQNILLERETELRAAIAQIEGAIAARTAQRQAADVAQKLPAIEREAALKSLQLQIDQRLFELDLQRIDPARRRLAELQAQLAIQREQLRIFIEEQRANIAAIRSQRDAATDPAARAILTRQLNVAVAETTREYQRQQLVLDDLTAQIAFQKRVVEEPVELGIRTAVDEFARGALDKFQTFADLTRGTITSLAGFISGAITDALDPTSDTTLRERFGQFLRDVANQIIQTLTQIAIAKLLLNVFDLGLGGVGGAVGAAIAAHRGGRVPEGRRAPTPAHFGPRARGFHGGGPPNPWDTVPAWLQPGEWVIRARSARRYGAEVLHAINEGIIEAGPLRALARARHAPAMRRRRAERGMQLGGLVQVAQRAADAREIRNTARLERQVLPVLVSSESNADRLLSGNDASFLRAVERNPDTIRGILDRGRRRT